MPTLFYNFKTVKEWHEFYIGGGTILWRQVHLLSKLKRKLFPKSKADDSNVINSSKILFGTAKMDFQQHHLKYLTKQNIEEKNVNVYF